MPALAVDGLSVRYARRVRALEDVTFDVAQRRTLAVVGPSGAGKSTLLRAIAGLIDVDAGSVFLGERSLANVAPQERRIALVFQEDALFASMSVRENLAFALRDRREAGARIEQLARALRIDEHLARRPRELSGGERQRIAIARALLSDPLALLLDEPLAHLDPELRARVRDEVAGVRQRFEGPIVFVTHDHAEAMAIGDELAVLVDGKIADRGDPQRVYESPSTLRVARFLGDRSMNALDDDADIVTCIRAEHIVVGRGELDGLVQRRESTGADVYLHLATSRGAVVARTNASTALYAGDRVSLAFPAECVRRFDRASGEAIA